MNESKYNLVPLLNYIEPGHLSYQEWLNVGMALNYEGYSCEVWDNWSGRDPARYHPGECEKKWAGFRGSDSPVTGGTIVQLAKENGWIPTGSGYNPSGYALDWGDTIHYVDLKVVDERWIEKLNIPGPPDNWNGPADLIRYLKTIFDSTDIVGYVTDCWERDGEFFPKKGNWNFTAGEMIDQLTKHGTDIGAALGDYNPDVGAWIRFNPLDGDGCLNTNVTGFRFALVESDKMPVEKQYAIIKEMQLPVACLVYSGGKSLHAIVRVDADDYEEYKSRVDFLYDACQKNGFEVDKQNRNPSRLSRMPGVYRNGKPQYLVDTNIGKESWAEWKDWIEGFNDDLPDEETEVIGERGNLAPELISGVLRQGHKLLLAGPAKAGKSFALIELAICISEGLPWMGFQCAKGKVMYVNLELDNESCKDRFAIVRSAMKAPATQPVKIWNLRGKAVPMDKLAPKLIRRAQKDKYAAIIIDPIYKVITGDENSADQMAAFCNQFDKVATELGSSVIYCHHHSKGAQGQKRSMDRASGSGVFARDPDALLDLIELDIPDNLREQKETEMVCSICREALEDKNVLDMVDPDDRHRESSMMAACEGLLKDDFVPYFKRIQDARKTAGQLTAWRIDGTLREFPRFKPIDLWFRYPIHQMDKAGELEDVKPESAGQTWKSNFQKKKSPEELKKEKEANLESAFDACTISGKVTVGDLAQFLGISEKTVRRRLKEHGGFWVDDGEVGRKN